MPNENKKNQPYLKGWDEYQNTRRQENKTAGKTITDMELLLLPLSVDIKNGIVERQLLSAAEAKRFYINNKIEIDSVCADAPAIFKDYDEFFAPGNVQGPRPDSPLDMIIHCKAMFLFLLPRKNWQFTDHTQISVDNDDELPNVECLGAVADGNALLVVNHYRNRDKHLKYNLHVTITQNENGKKLKTDIIIDPGMNNDKGPGD